MGNTEQKVDKLEALYSQFKESAKKKENKKEKISLNRLDKDYKLEIPFSEYNTIREKGFNKGIILKAIENTESFNKNTGVLLTLCNGFVVGVMSQIYDCDLGLLRSKLQNLYERNEYHLFISQEIKNNKKAFLKALN